MEICLLQDLCGSPALQFCLHSSCKQNIKTAHQDHLFLASSPSLVSAVLGGVDTGVLESSPSRPTKNQS